LFVPAVVEMPLVERAVSGRKRTRAADRSSGIIEVDIDGMTVRVGRGAEAKTVAAVLRALKSGA
jgi:transposase